MKKSWMVLAMSMSLVSLDAFAQGSPSSSSDQSAAIRRSGSMDQFSNPNRWGGALASSSEQYASASDAIRRSGSMDQFSNPNRSTAVGSSVSGSGNEQLTSASDAIRRSGSMDQFSNSHR